MMSCIFSRPCSVLHRVGTAETSLQGGAMVSPGPVAILRHVSPALLTVCPFPVSVLFSQGGQPTGQPSNALGIRDTTPLPFPSLLPFPPLPCPSSDVRDEIWSTPEASDAWKYQEFKREEIKQVADMYCRLSKLTWLDITADTPFDLILAPKMGLSVDPTRCKVPMSVITYISIVPAGKCQPDNILLDLPQAEHETVKVKSVRWMGNNENRKLACATIVEYELDKEEVRVKQECVRQVMADVKKNKQQVQIELFAAKNAERRKVSACSHVDRMRKAQVAVCLKPPGSIWGRRAVPVQSSRRSSCAGGRSQPVCLGGQTKH